GHSALDAWSLPKNPCTEILCAPDRDSCPRVTFLPYWTLIYRLLQPSDTGICFNRRLQDECDLDSSPGIDCPPAKRVGQSASPVVEGVACPYLKEQDSLRRESTSPSQPFLTVLENLQNLEQAATTYRQAESLREHGNLDDARTAYESIHQLCPGSRLDVLAREQLQRLIVPMTIMEWDEEEPLSTNGCSSTGASASMNHHDALRDLFNIVRSVDRFTDGMGTITGRRISYHLQLRFAFLRGSCDADGHGYFEFGIGIPGGGQPDVRAAQWAHDEKVSRWIELKSGNGDKKNPADLYELEDELWP